MILLKNCVAEDFFLFSAPYGHLSLERDGKAAVTGLPKNFRLQRRIFHFFSNRLNLKVSGHH